MRRMPVFLMILLAVVLLSTVPAMAARTKKLACPAVLAAPGSDLTKIAGQLDVLIRENLARIEGLSLLETAPVAAAAGQADQAALMQLDTRTIVTLGSRLGADMVMVARLETDAASGRLRIIAHLVNATNGTLINRIKSEEAFDRQNQLIGLFVNQLHLAVRSSLGESGSEFSETAFSLDVQTERPPGMDSLSGPSSVRSGSGSGYKFQNKYTLSILFDFQMPLLSFGGEASSILGMDFIVELEDNFYAFGGGIQVMGSSFIELRAVAEFHFLRIVPDQIVQVFLRTTPGFLYPITADGFAFRMANSIGARFRLGSFLLDTSFGIDFRSTESSALLVGIASGMRF